MVHNKPERSCSGPCCWIGILFSFIYTKNVTVDKTHSLFKRNGTKRLPYIQFSSKTQRLGKLCKPILITLVQTVQTWFFILAKNKSNICTEQSPSWWRKSYKSNLQRPASKNSISKWTVSLMKYVYEQYIETLPSVSSHDTRKMSTSYAFLNGASVLVYCSLKPLLPRSVRRTFLQEELDLANHFKMHKREGIEVPVG